MMRLSKLTSFYLLTGFIALALGYAGALLIGADQQIIGFSIPLRPFMALGFILGAIVAALSVAAVDFPKSFLGGVGAMTLLYLAVSPLLAHAAVIGDPEGLYAPTLFTIVVMGAFAAPIAFFIARMFVKSSRT